MCKHGTLPGLILNTIYHAYIEHALKQNFIQWEDGIGWGRVMDVNRVKSSWQQEEKLLMTKIDESRIVYIFYLEIWR